MDSTLKKYRRATVAFAAFVGDYFPWIDTAAEYDDALAEFKDLHRPRKSDFETLVAAVEWRFPQFKGHLPWARTIIKGWGIEHTPHHTVPMSRGHARLWAAWLVSLGAERLAIALLVQRELGLRPSEVLGLRGADVALPESQTLPVCRAVFGLGLRAGTKAKRAQAVVLRCPMLIGLVRYALSAVGPNDRIFPYSYSQYSRLLKAVDAKLNLSSGFTPHSPRAGFASESIAERGVVLGD